MPMKMLLLAAATAVAMVPLAPAEAFWVARGWRGGVAVGGVGLARPPLVEPRVVYPECWRCATYPAAGAVAAGVAVGAAAGARAAAASSAAGAVAVAPPPAAAHAAATTTAAPPPAPAQASAPAPAAPPAPAPATQTAAAGGRAAADACAQKLPAEAKLIYDATVAHLGGGASPRDVVSTQTRALVMQGKVQMSSARSSAEATAPCLELLAKG